MTLKISHAWMEEGEALIESGDISLEATKARFLALSGRETTLENDALLAALMIGEPDGEDDAGFVKAVEDIEANGFQFEDSPPEKPANDNHAHDDEGTLVRSES